MTGGVLADLLVVCSRLCNNRIDYNAGFACIYDTSGISVSIVNACFTYGMCLISTLVVFIGLDCLSSSGSTDFDYRSTWAVSAT